MFLSEVKEKKISGQILPLEKESSFRFACHKGLTCFTECCRLLDLELTPYDVLRLRRATGLSSTAFLDQYVILERDPGKFFPNLYLTMVDDGMASCPFVSKKGCTVYANRPGACRAYPLGRAYRLLLAGHSVEQFILIREPHCLGFREKVEQTVEKYCSDQGLLEYNRFNDHLALLLKHEGIQLRGPLSPDENALFILCLYDLDRFRDFLKNNQSDNITPLTEQNLLSLDDEDLLIWAIDWLKQRFFM